MTSEVTLNVPTMEKEKELKDDVPADNGQSKDEAPPAGAVAVREKAEKGEEKCDEKKGDFAPPKTTVHKANYDKDVVYLYQFSRTPLMPSTSPYCLKVETWLRLAGIKYENVDHKAKFRSKKGQLPFVELNGEEIADSTFIIKELSDKFGKDLDAALTAEQRAVSHALISMIENHLSWVVLWWRAKYPESVLRGYHLDLQTALNTRLPNPILNFCYKFTTARKGMKKAKAHGIGVHSQEEIVELGTNDLRVLSDMLADKTYFFGDEPSLLDVVAFANLSQLVLIDKEVVHPLREVMAAASPNLVSFVARLKQRAFPDWEQLCAPPPPPPATRAAKEPSSDTPDNTDKLPLPDDKDKDGEKEKGHEKEVDEKNEKDNENKN